MSKEINIQIAEIGNIDEIYILIKKCFSAYQKTLGVDGKLAALHETKDDIENDILNNQVYICIFNGKIVGSARITKKLNDAELTRFGIDPDHQTLGIGGLLLSRIIDDCIDSKIDSVSLHSACGKNSSVGFYENYNFVIEEETHDLGYRRAKLVLHLK